MISNQKLIGDLERTKISFENEWNAIPLESIHFMVENNTYFLKVKAILEGVAANRKFLELIKHPLAASYRQLDEAMNEKINACVAPIFSNLNRMIEEKDYASYQAIRPYFKNNLLLLNRPDDERLAAFDATALEGCPKGIKNITNSCYMAASIQALLALKPVKSKLVSDIERKEGETAEAFAEREKIQKALQALVEALLQKKEESPKLEHLRDLIFSNQHLNADLRKGKLDQQDAAALMMMLLEVLNASFMREIKWWVDNLPPPAPIVKPSYLLEVELKKGKNLQQLIDEHFAPTAVVDPDNKRRLGNYGEFDKWTTQEKIIGGADFLIIHLKRFGNDLQKITAPVPFHASGAIDFSSAFGDQKTHLYKLVSTVRHSGTLKGGHYVAHAWHRDRWIEYDDSVITLNAQVGNEENRQNYLLLFELINDQ